MSRNQKNIIKFLIAVIALVLFGYCVCHDPFTWREGVGIILSAIIGAWYVWHVFNDE